MSIQSYQEVCDHLRKERRQKHLLLGNGFSVSYDKNIFSYNALTDFINNTDNLLLKKLFGIINTTNFELVMSQLDTFHKLAAEFIEDGQLAEMIISATDALKKNLVDAISALHPEQAFKISKEKSESCARFIKGYLDRDGHVFTTNYDLLLYWVLMTNQDQLSNIIDGFGREYLESGEFEKDLQPEFGELEWGPNRGGQHIHYLHGALHLFDTKVAIEKEVYDGDYLLSNIKQRIAKKEYPIFVTAGDGNQKLDHILHNQYLDFCYKKLSSICGSLVTFGFSFGQYDYHIIDAINKAARQPIQNRLRSIYIGIFSDSDQKYINSITGKFKCKVHIFDAKTVDVWGVNSIEI